jgi:hypothetical protein
MTTSRCAYCGALAEAPVQLAWVITGDVAEEHLTGSHPLCLECSQSWCPLRMDCLVSCLEEDRS